MGSQTGQAKQRSLWSHPHGHPGISISSLMPHCASILDKLTVIRSMSTEPKEHFQAIDALTRGEPPRPPFTRPILGSVIAQQLGQLDSPVPQFVFLDPCPEGNEFKGFKKPIGAGWLGAEYGPVRFGGKYKIENTSFPRAGTIWSMRKGKHSVRFSVGSSATTARMRGPLLQCGF